MAAENMSADQAIWLVKSSDKIFGPFSDEELRSRLKNREFMVIDEVARPMSRWRVVRDEPMFAGVVDEIRKGQMNSREDTEVQGHTNTRTLTQTETMTATETTNFLRDVAESANPRDRQSVRVIAQVDSMPIDTSQVKDAEFVDLDHQDTRGSQERETKSKVRQYGIDLPDYKSQRDSSRLQMVIWLVAGFVAIGALAMLMRNQEGGEKAGPETQAELARTLTDANYAWRTGDFMTALKFYREANRASPRKPEIVARLAPLLIQLEVQTVTAKRLLTDLLNSPPADLSPLVRAELEMGMGLASLMSDDLPDASTHFQSSIKLNGANSSAKFNAGVVSFQQRSFVEADRLFGSAGDQPHALLMRARSLIADGNSTVRASAVEALGRLTSKSYDFLQEGLVLAAHLQIENGNKKLAQDLVREALDVDPDLTNDHWHDPFIYLEPLGWRSLLSSCRKLADELRTPPVRALLGLCLFKAGNRSEAADTVKDAVAQAPIGPNQQILQAVNAYLLATTGRIEDARAALRLAQKTEAPFLASYVGARICARSGDQACAERSWKAILQLQPRSLAAHVGMADIALVRNDSRQAADWINKALAISSTYVPALTRGAATKK